MPEKGLKQSIYFFITLLMLNFIYFFIYFIYLNAIVSIINLWFITLATLSYFVLMHFLKWKVWEILSYLILAIYFIFSLVNFAYFKVFGTFIDFQINSLNSVNGSMFDLLKDYLFLIPLELFLVSIIIFVIVITARIHFEHTGKLPSLNFQDTKIQLRSKRRFSTIAILIVIIIFQNMPAVPLSVLFWEISISKTLLLVITAFIGFIFGILFKYIFSKKKIRKMEQPEYTIKIRSCRHDYQEQNS